MKSLEHSIEVVANNRDTTMRRTLSDSIELRIQYYNKTCKNKGFKYGYLAVEYMYGECRLYYCSAEDIEKNCLGGLLAIGTKKHVYEVICAFDTMLNYQS